MRRAAVGAVLVLLASLLQLGVSTPAVALTLPAGFQLVDYPTGQAEYNLTNFAWLEDGGLLTSGKDGTITFVPPGGAPRVIGKVPSVRAVADHGLLGFAPARDYPTTGRVYVSYDKGDPAATGFGMLEEWKAFPPADPTMFTHSRTLIDGSLTSPQLVQAGLTHGIDTVLVAPDDSLFLSIGDNAGNQGDPLTLRAQDLDEPYGKLLHLTEDGEGVPTNPYYSETDPDSWRSMVYASGFRNPFRFTLDPRSGVVHLGDVGWGKTEEVNTIRSGANAGWPCYEGLDRTTFSSQPVCEELYAEGSARMPIWTYPHAHAHAAVVGGLHYTGTAYPAEYQGSYFFGDYSRGMLWTLRTSKGGRLVQEPEAAGFAVDAGGPVAFHAGPNGDITYADILTGNVRRLVYTAGNRSPTAKIASVTDPDSRTVSFSADQSYDLDEDALSYHWSFGDGEAADGIDVEHTYASDAPVEATLTVTDQLGAAGTASTTVHPANHSPQLVLDTPPPRTYAVGDTVELSATATDVEDGDLTVSWHTALKHCPFTGSCHIHPEGTTTGPSYAEPFTDHGSDTTMVVTVHAQDSTGTTTTLVYEATPTLRKLVVDSPVPVTLNGELATSADVVPGSTVQVEAPQTSSYWEFRKWSDGGARAHAFQMPDADLSLVARYRSAIDTKYAALGGRSSFLGPATSPEYDVAGGRVRRYAGGRLFWSAGTGAHEVHGRILEKYSSIGSTQSCLGFPTTDVRQTRTGLRSDFTGGRIVYRRDTGKVVSVC